MWVCLSLGYKNDMVNDITSFRGRNAGGTAMWLPVNKVQRMFI